MNKHDREYFRAVFDRHGLLIVTIAVVVGVALSVVIMGEMGML